jgi:Xaa-Pro aminopeptidase
MLKKHPRALAFIFFTEMWERVGSRRVTIEDMVVVTKDGAEWLGRPQKDIVLVR